jgi:hypothetical protein
VFVTDGSGAEGGAFPLSRAADSLRRERLDDENAQPEAPASPVFRAPKAERFHFRERRIHSAASAWMTKNVQPKAPASLY